MTTAMFTRLLDTTNPIAALVVQEGLRPISGNIIFPPTYAGGEGENRSRYNLNPINRHNVGVLATIDSIPSQANRIEPMFMQSEYVELVPQIIVNAGEYEKNLLEMGHRLADAAIRFTELNEAITHAFNAYKLNGDAMPLAKLGPTSLIFGAWDSRSVNTQTKIPRLLSAEIVATDVEELSNRFSTFNAAFDYNQFEISKDDASIIGLANALDSGKALGGVFVHGRIQRNVTLNLNGLRAVKKSHDAGQTNLLQHYLLGLALLAIYAPISYDLRQGCHLVSDSGKPRTSTLILQDGTETTVDFGLADIVAFAKQSATAFGVGENQSVCFDQKQVEQAILGMKGKKEKKEQKEKGGKKTGKADKNDSNEENA
ncbi:type I-U CRISPR-associated RAMP protein Csb1/Cas7u [Thiothrix unzii]|jgi:CRISPR-associated protein Csb1|uniref:type I-G CRISPR-associated RAMP protein Csb1/Cas7g n=1 Tax=Thiothrix unzii TaxID=111769 RepID=UPI002A36DB72|nr:type I-U CRISPR-associated RAMP protein Csb1/Cas7u [Thiothrix unzii]MDX9990394.1 type I-U CRISPR-associated RAMP protein Csb1/Cas7u [Thiothrix unzii]